MTTNRSTENLLFTKDKDFRLTKRSVFQTKTKRPVPNEITKSNSCSTKSYGVWDKRHPNNLVSTSADVHRHHNATPPPDSEPNEPTPRRVPVPLPRRKLPQETSKDPASPTSDLATFFSQSRQNTIISQHEDSLSETSSLHSRSLNVGNENPIPKPRNLLNDTKHKSSAFDSRESKINESIELKTFEKKSMESMQSEDDRSDDDDDNDTSTASDYASESSHSEKPAVSYHSLNEKKVSKSLTKVAPPKPARKLRSAGPASAAKSGFRAEKLLYDKLIGIYIHESSALNFDYMLITPMVRVSIYDVVSGQLLLKSDPGRSVVQHKEPDAVNFIQPLVSRCCTFKQSHFIECVWEELLLINDDIQCLQTGNEIVFFEIVSMVNMAKKEPYFGVTDGWHHICWAFLRPGDGQSFSHIDERSRLQLYVYQTKGIVKPRRQPILDQWRMKRKKYPATLDVTLKGILPTSGSQVSLKSRPMHALEGDILQEFTFSPSGHDLLDNHITNEAESNCGKSVEDSFAHLLGLDRRLPGQSCKIPNHVNAALHQANTKGCLVSKFSPNGQQLALAVIPDTSGQPHDIIIVQVPGFRKLALLQGHTAVIYTLHWYAANDQLCYLLSVSSDRTAIVWTLNGGCVKLSLSILPHPCFVYAGVILSFGLTKQNVFSVTGGRDGLLRVWKSSKNQLTDLVQELHGHESYITSIVSTKDSKKLYTSDAVGCILEWKKTSSALYEKIRIVKSFHSNIRSMQLHRNEETLFVRCSTVTSLNIRSGVQLHTFEVNHAEDPQRVSFAVSPCGALMVTTSDSILQGWNLLTGQKTTAYAMPLHSAVDQHNYISSIDFHPFNFKLSITVYGSNFDSGAIILDNDNQPPIRPPPAEDPPTTSTKLLDNVAAVPKQQQQQDLDGIIQRIDDIFRLPQNRTDDLKSRSTITQTGNTYVLDNDSSQSSAGMMELQSLSNQTLQRSATFTVANSDSKASKANAANRTFSVSGGRQQGRRTSGTYNIGGGDGDDDTTISESL